MKLQLTQRDRRVKENNEWRTKVKKERKGEGKQEIQRKKKIEKLA